jgi:hypothetical protein
MRNSSILNWKNTFIGVAALTISLSVYPADSDRIAQLEKEVQDLKVRISNLEGPQNNTSPIQKIVSPNDGWKRLANWRTLKKGMSFDEVRAILGEPGRIQGGSFTFWTYPDRASVTFYNDRLDGWTEPR